MANRAAINTVLIIYGFCTTPQRNFILDSEGLDSWTSFTLVDYDDLPSIAKDASHHTGPFPIGVIKLKCLAAWKFWIKDLIQMSETHAATAFTRPTMMVYIQLYVAYTKAKDCNIEFVNGPQFDKEDWIGFETGTFECLASIQGNNGVPLSYLLRDNQLRPALTVSSLRKTKIL